jgi:hypothetical protein
MVALALGWRRSRRCGRRAGRIQRDLVAVVAFPGLVGQLFLPEKGDVVVAIGHFRHHRPGEAGIGLVHQLFGIFEVGSDAVALDLQLLAIVEIVSGGIDESEGRTVQREAIADVAHSACTTGKSDAERQQRHDDGGARQGFAVEHPGEHATLINGQSCAWVKQALMSALRLLPYSCPLEKGVSTSPAHFHRPRKRAKSLISRPKRTWRNW